MLLNIHERVELLSLAYKTVSFFAHECVLFKRFTSQPPAAASASVAHSFVRDRESTCTSPAHRPKSSLISDTSLLSSLHLFPPPPLPPVLTSKQHRKKIVHLPTFFSVSLSVWSGTFGRDAPYSHAVYMHSCGSTFFALCLSASSQFFFARPFLHFISFD